MMIRGRRPPGPSGRKRETLFKSGGPRGPEVLADALNWYWLTGDETALPAIGRRMAEMPDSKIHAVVAVAGADEQNICRFERFAFRPLGTSRCGAHRRSSGFAGGGQRRRNP